MMPSTFIVILTLPSASGFFFLSLLLGRSLGTSDILLLFHHVDRLTPAGPAQSLWWGPFQDPENSSRSVNLMGISGTAL